MELNGNFTDNTTAKYRRLYANYLLILKKHGDYSKLMPKKILYAEAGDTVWMAPKTAGKIINTMIKDNVKLTEFEMAEAKKAWKGNES